MLQNKTDKRLLALMAYTIIDKGSPSRLHNSKEMKTYRRKLRTYGTKAEAIMWLMLKNRQMCGCRFRRQYSAGCYILDFYSPELRLAIELDGEPHFADGAEEADNARSQWLESEMGIKVIRFENELVINAASAVVQAIEEAIADRKKEFAANKPNAFRPPLR